jgi:hypothetical protein
VRRIFFGGNIPKENDLVTYVWICWFG